MMMTTVAAAAARRGERDLATLPYCCYLDIPHSSCCIRALNANASAPLSTRPRPAPASATRPSYLPLPIRRSTSPSCLRPIEHARACALMRPSNGPNDTRRVTVTVQSPPSGASCGNVAPPWSKNVRDHDVHGLDGQSDRRRPQPDQLRAEDLGRTRRRTRQCTSTPARVRGSCTPLCYNGGGLPEGRVRASTRSGMEIAIADS